MSGVLPFRLSYLLVVIDVLTEYAWGKQLRDNMTKSVFSGLEQILQRNDSRQLYTFKRTWARNSLDAKVQNLLKKRNIIYRAVRDPDDKAAVAEHFIRTLKERIWCYFTHLNTRRYIDVLDGIVDTRSQPPVYTFKDLEGEKIDGYFYEQKLSRVCKDLSGDVLEVLVFTSW
ncbi:hypothetical protein TSAR_007777 [Trichomalopsis sarcophagae]|uniref:Uncharacterized protein n=1 Tax=Trichomalopsis sarcophagae TaxID=543379 RepID=A0A232FKU1_9HYME|nr:hypothetical protein TSAR_007777 [Trichomalopsis sarcophagae]